jgi:hypothetical protein
LLKLKFNFIYHHSFTGLPRLVCVRRTPAALISILNRSFSNDFSVPMLALYINPLVPPHPMHFETILGMLIFSFLHLAPMPDKVNALAAIDLSAVTPDVDNSTSDIVPGR